LAENGSTTQIVRVAGAVLALFLVIGIAQPASAEEYPSWSEVERARANETSKQTQIAELTHLISALTADVSAARRVTLG